MTPNKLIARIFLQLCLPLLVGIAIAAFSDWEGSNALALRMGSDIVSVISFGGAR